MRCLFQCLEPRARVLTIVCITIVVVSTPRGTLLPFAAYAPLCLALILTGCVSAKHLLRRCWAASPFILLAAGMLALQTRDADAPLSIACKGYAAALLLAFLTASTTLADLLAALRRLGIPESLNLILGLMYRYTTLLAEEYSRMERARDCRTVRPLGTRRFAIYGRQLGALILRSWDRAERVHAAMLSRGFDGAWPAAARRSLTPLDVGFVAGSSGLFLAARLLL